MAKDFRPPYSVFSVLSNPYPSAAVLYLSNTAALKSLSTHGLPFRRLRRCVFWSDWHRTTDGGALGLTRSPPRADTVRVETVTREDRHFQCVANIARRLPAVVGILRQTDLHHGRQRAAGLEFRLAICKPSRHQLVENQS